MKNIRIGIGVILGLLLIVMYELTINSIDKNQKLKELSALADVLKAQLENRLKESFNAIDHLTTLCLLDSDLTQDTFQEYSKNQIGNHFQFVQLQFADVRFDTIYTYPYAKVKGKYSEEFIPAISLDYGGKEMRRAVELESIFLQGNLTLPDGRNGSAYWVPVFRNSTYFGMVTAVFAHDELFTEILQEDRYDSINMSIIDGADTHIYGEEQLYRDEVTVAVSIADRSWYISLKWDVPPSIIPAEKRILTIFAGCIFIISLAYLCRINVHQWQSITREREDLKSELDAVKEKYDEEKNAIFAAEKALRESEERYKALFDNNPIQTIVVDNTCRIVMYNFAGIRKEGRTPVIGALMYKDYAEHHQIDMFSELVRCIESGEQKEFPELKYKERYLHIHISPFSEGAIITSIDVTATKRLFEQLQQSHKMEAVGTLAGGIAHEFNNILGIIIGNVELAVDEIDNKDISRECLAEIRSATIRAKDVVRQLLSFSRQKNRKKGPMKVGSLVEDSIKNLVRPSIPNSIEIFSSIQKNVSMIMGDPLQIQQILINLCNNSAQAMEKERGKIHIELKEIVLRYERAEIFQKIRPGHYVQITVKDNGKGIRPDVQEKIFDPYFTTREVGQGTGMGLAIVHGIVKDHGGEIVFSSSESEGTEMHILFPPLIGRSSVS